MLDIKLAGENAIIIYFGDEIYPELSQKIAFYLGILQQELGDLIIDVVPSYASLLISYHITKIDHQAFCQQVRSLLTNTTFTKQQQQLNLVKIPVYYDPEVGLDLVHLLLETELSLDEFIIKHSAPYYSVYAIGFSPAFAFLGEVDKKIQLPRLKTPRVRVPAGSVGIADNQTAVYPIDTPGGWNIVGRTPLDLSLNKPENLQRFKVGYHAKFKPISRQQFIAMGGEL